MPRRDTLLAALVAVIWGFNFVVISWGMRSVPPLLFAAVRFALVAVPAVWFVPRPDAPWRVVVAVGAFMSLGQFALLYSAIHAGMPPGLSALVLQSQVLFTIAIAAIGLRERPSTLQLAGVAVALAGLVIVGVGRGGHVPAGALLLCLAAGLSWAIGNVVSRGSGIRGGLGLTIWSATVVPVPMLALSLVLDGPGEIADALVAFSWRSAVSTAYTAGLASVFGYAVFNGLLSRHRASDVVPWSLVAPVVAMVAAWGLLGQRPNAAEVIGGLTIVGGVLVSLRSPSGSVAPPPAPPLTTVERPPVR